MDSGMDCVFGQHRVYSGELRFIHGDYVCDDCALDIAARFQRALEHEADYPPRWGTQPIHIRPYLEYLPPTFLRDYTERMREYGTNVNDRIYCQARLRATGDFCNRFLGPLSTNSGSQYRCIDCTNTTCACCRAVLVDFYAPHTCAVEQHTATIDPLAGTTRGVDYQLCPNPACHETIYIDEGCNHMICPRCHTHYCHICGEHAPEHSGHWMPGGCPRYGLPTDPDPEFDYVFDLNAPAPPMPAPPTPVGTPELESDDEAYNADSEPDSEDSDDSDEPRIPDEPTMINAHLLVDGVMPFEDVIRQLQVRERGRALQHLPYYLQTDYITTHNHPLLAPHLDPLTLNLPGQALHWTGPLLDLVHTLAATHFVGFHPNAPPRSLGEILYTLRFLLLQAQTLQFAAPWDGGVEEVDDRFADMAEILRDPDIEVLAEEGMEALDRAVVDVARRGGWLEGVWWVCRLRAMRAAREGDEDEDEG